MDRITNADLDRLVDRINTVTDSPMTPYSKPEKPGDRFTANLGNYHINGAYGGVQLVRMGNNGGGISTISTNGYETKRQLYTWMTAFLAGLRA